MPLAFPGHNVEMVRALGGNGSCPDIATGWAKIGEGMGAAVGHYFLGRCEELAAEEVVVGHCVNRSSGAHYMHQPSPITVGWLARVWYCGTSSPAKLRVGIAMMVTWGGLSRQ